MVDFLVCTEERHRQDARLVDLKKPTKCIRYEHFEMEGLHIIQQLIRRNDLITKVDPSDFYMHFLIGHSDRRYMRFMWEGKKYHCIDMPFGFEPAPRLATEMMAPVSDCAAIG